jgi:heterodisulfide reductase subunit A
MYTAKQASLYRQRVPQGQPYIFFMDVRSTAKGCEEFIKKVMSEQRILYIRGRVSKIFRQGDKLVVWGADTLTGNELELEADLVVLATAMVPSPDATEVAKKLKIAVDQFGFVSEAHPKLRPVESLTAGIYLAGTAQAPKDIADTVNQAGGAASKVLAFLSKEELLHEPTVSHVDEEVCSGCGYCVANCAYEAISLDPKKRVARVNEVLCEGCGACAATCPSGAIQLRNFSAKQLLDMIDVATEEYAFAEAAAE